MKLNISKGKFKIPTESDLKKAIKSFSKIEWRFFVILVGILIVSTILILNKINQKFMTEIPVKGGFVSEGIIGSPRFVNPVLAFSDTDKDLIPLLYSGLLRRSTDGNLIEDIAEGYNVSEDGLTYTFYIKEGLKFHDGEPLDADDVIFTIEEIKDPLIKSPKEGLWEGVQIEKIDQYTVQFSLQKPYASFLENTTLGILPSHIWLESTIELNEANTKPIGSGPFQIKKIDKTEQGEIKSYTLTPFKDFSLGAPYLKKITLKFYLNEDDLLSAYRSGDISQISSISPENAIEIKEKGKRIETSTLPRVFGLFFNPNQNQKFLDKTILTAINLGINKDRIVSEVLSDYGEAIDSPIPQNFIELDTDKEEKTLWKENTEKAKQILEKDGWEMNEAGYMEKEIDKELQTLEFSISTGSAKELVKTAELIKQDLSTIGIKTEIKTFEVGNLNQLVIRPRKYESLLFGQIINSESDLYAFWHSSQRKDPGLNVATYTNAKVDKLLEDALEETDKEERLSKYKKFEEEIKEDKPAIFIYSPSFIYVIPKNLKGLDVNNLISPESRFSNSYLWYTKVDSVWKIFAK